MLCRNRNVHAKNGVAYGGVALVWREAVGSFRLVELKNPKPFEVLVGAGSIKGHS